MSKYPRKTGPLSSAPKYAKSVYGEFGGDCYLAARDGFHDGACYALKQIESGKAAVTIRALNKNGDNSPKSVVWFHGPCC